MSARLEWVEYSPLPTCGVTRTPKSVVSCEFPRDHFKSDLGPDHLGRNRPGAWIGWPAIEAAKEQS